MGVISCSRGCNRLCFRFLRSRCWTAPFASCPTHPLRWPRSRHENMRAFSRNRDSREHAGGGITLARILVVDDNSVNLRVCRLILERFGHTVVTETNPVAALNGMATELPDVLVTDLMMPILDGITLTRARTRVTRRWHRCRSLFSPRAAKTTIRSGRCRRARPRISPSPSVVARFRTRWIPHWAASTRRNGKHAPSFPVTIGLVA